MLYGWEGSVNLQHNEACRTRIEAELATTVKGKARLELSKTRIERREGAAIAEDQQAGHGKEEETVAAVPPSENLPTPDAAPLLQPSADDAVHFPEPLRQSTNERRGVAPPESARAMPRIQPGELVDSDDDEEE